MDYKQLSNDFKKSGLSQTAYGKKIGISTSMVSYYLKKARLANKSKSSVTNFVKLEVVDTTNKDKSIRIKTSTGVEIEIPL